MKLLLLTLNQQKVNKSGCHCLAKPRATPQSPESSSIQIVVHELWPIIIFSHHHVISVLRTTGKQSKQTSNRRCSQFSQHLKSPGPASPRHVTFPQSSHFQSSVLLRHFANSRLQQCQTATWISCPCDILRRWLYSLSVSTVTKSPFTACMALWRLYPRIVFWFVTIIPVVSDFLRLPFVDDFGEGGGGGGRFGLSAGCC